MSYYLYFFVWNILLLKQIFSYINFYPPLDVWSPSLLPHKLPVFWLLLELFIVFSGIVMFEWMELGATQRLSYLFYSVSLRPAHTSVCSTCVPFLVPSCPPQFPSPLLYSCRALRLLPVFHCYIQWTSWYTQVYGCMRYKFLEAKLVAQTYNLIKLFSQKHYSSMRSAAKCWSTSSLSSPAWCS